MQTALKYIGSLTLILAVNGVLAETSTSDSAGLGIGRPVSAREIAAWDIDVKPDGSGLPAGSGTVAQGRASYRDKCMSCHGVEGRGCAHGSLAGRLPNDAFPFGTDAGTVKTIGNYWPYATTLFDYINRAMPYDAPGSLHANEVYGLVAYLLFLNNISIPDETVSDQSLAEIRMPARDRFVPDDRRGGDEIR